MIIGVLMGGVSSEREVSLNTGKQIVENLDKNKYKVVPIVIDKQDELLEKTGKVEFVFNALHGNFGEDGTVQALLDSIGKPYSGCDALTSTICMNKAQTKKIFRDYGFDTPNWMLINDLDDNTLAEPGKFQYPVVIKPNNGGSSIGVCIANNLMELKGLLKDSLKCDKDIVDKDIVDKDIVDKDIVDKDILDQGIIIEEYIAGEEYTVSLLDGKVLPVVKIKPKSVFFNYKAKYLSQDTKIELVDLPKELDYKIWKVIKKCWQIFNCKVYARIDIIVKDDKVYLLEINTLPGMTSHSLLPISAKAAGISFQSLLDKIISYSLRDWEKSKPFY